VAKLRSRGHIRDIAAADVRVSSSVYMTPQHKIDVPAATVAALGPVPATSSIAAAAHERAKELLELAQARATKEHVAVTGTIVDRVLAAQTGASLRFIWNGKPSLNPATAPGAAGGFDMPLLSSILTLPTR
jgi:hypothetical protein